MSSNTDNGTVAIIDQSNRKVLAGYPFTLDCGVLAENNLEPEEGGVLVTWYKDGTSLSTGLSFTLNSPSEEDSGNYYFVAENAFGSTTSDSVNIEIVTPGDDQFGVNLVANGDGADGLSSWTPQQGTFRINKFWFTSGDKSFFGAWSRFPNPGNIDRKYRHRDGLVYFTAEDQEYEQKTGDVRTFIRPNDGQNLTSCFQDIFITDPDTIDIIDRKVEGVFDVEAKMFGWLGQTRSCKVYFRDWKWNGGWRTSKGSKKSAYDDNSDNPADDYVETIREIHDESTLRYELYDANDEMMRSFTMDSFRPTKRSNAAVAGYKSISLPPGTRRVRIIMMFRRADREHEWHSRRSCFAKPYRCGIYGVNLRLFINKDGLKFLSLRFNPNDVIDLDLQNQIEQQIMDSQMELQKCYDAIEDLGNIEVKNAITKNYSHSAIDGTLQYALKYLAEWTRKEISQYAHKDVYVGNPLPGLPGSDWYNEDKAKIDDLPAGVPDKVENVHPSLSTNEKHYDLRLKCMGDDNYLQQDLSILAGNYGETSYIYRYKVPSAALLAHHINYYLHPDFDTLMETIIAAYYQSNMTGVSGNQTGIDPWWEVRFNQLTAPLGNLNKFVRVCKGLPQGSPVDIDAKFKLAVVLASYELPHHHYEPAYPKSLKWLFWRPIKAGQETNFFHKVGTSLLGAGTSQYNNPWNSYGSGYSGFGGYYSSWHNHWTRYTDTIAALYDKGNYSIFHDTQYSKDKPLLSKQYIERFVEAVQDAGNRRTYDGEIQMTVREIYDSVFDGDYSSAVYTDAVVPYVPPCALRTKHWEAPNPDDPDTWENLPEQGDFATHLHDRLEDLTNEGNEFTYSQANQGNKKIGFRYPCERSDENPVSYYNGHNDTILIPVAPSATKVIYPNPPGLLWWRERDLMYNMNKYTVMDYSVDDMVDKIDELPALKNFFECTRSPMIFNEQISMRPAPYTGTPTGNLTYTDENRQNSWHGYYSHYRYMGETLLTNTRQPFLDLGHTFFENHKGLSVPEFYKKSVLSGDTENMPADAPFRYQGANPIKCLTEYNNTDGYTSFSINKNNNLSLPEGSGSQSAKNRLDKLLRTYAMSIARADLLRKRIKFLRSELDDALDWVDTQGDEYGYDQTNTAVDEDTYNTTGEE